MPATILDDPLGIACVFSDGARAEFTLAGLPNPRLATDLLAGLAELIHPHGSVDAAGTVDCYVQSIRHMVRKLAAAGFTGPAADLRRPVLGQYWMATTDRREGCTRRMLQGLHASGGRLDARVVELAEGRAYNSRHDPGQLPPYGEGEWTRLRQVCRTVVDDGFAAHRRALVAAERGRHPNEGGWTPDNLRWLLARVGPVGTAGFGRQLGGVAAGTVRERGGFYEASTDLFPDAGIAIAYRLLFGIYSGIVPDGIDDLLVEDIDWAGDATILLSYVKGRTGGESLTLPRRAMRLLEQWLAHSALLRSHTGPAQRRRLWLGIGRRGGNKLFSTHGAAGRVAIQRWVQRHEVTGDDGKPLKIHRSRIRTTHHAMREKRAWTGSSRATIDPNHSPHVEGDHYLSAPTGTQRHAIESVVEDAQHDLLRRAHPPAVLDQEDAVALARDYPQLIAERGLTDSVIAELVGGERDVFTAACADQLSGLHGPKGKPCPARPWVCLLCPLAVFAPRHAGNLLRLKAFFSRQWQGMPAAQFMAIFGPYAQRIDQVLDRYDPAVLAQAARGVGDHDDELPLRPEESTR